MPLVKIVELVLVLQTEFPPAVHCFGAVAIIGGGFNGFIQYAKGMNVHKECRNGQDPFPMIVMEHLRQQCGRVCKYFHWTTIWELMG